MRITLIISTMDLFPDEILEHILLFLPVDSLVLMKYVCHLFNNLVDLRLIAKTIVKNKLTKTLLPNIIKNYDLLMEIYPLLGNERDNLPRLLGCLGSKKGLNWCIDQGLFISQSDIYQIIYAGHQDLVLDLIPKKSLLRYIIDYEKPCSPEYVYPRIGRKFFVCLLEDYGGSKCIGKIIRDYQSLIKLNPYPEVILIYMIENQLFDQMKERINDDKIHRSNIDDIIGIYRDRIKTLFPLIEIFFRKTVKHIISKSKISRSEIENDSYFHFVSFETLVWYADLNKIPYSEITINIPSFLSIGELEKAQQMGFKIKPYKRGGYFQIINNLDNLSWLKNHGFELTSSMQIEDAIRGAMLYGNIEILEQYHHKILTFQEIALEELGKNQYATNWYLENYGFPNDHDIIAKMINVLPNTSCSDRQYFHKLDEKTISTVIRKVLLKVKPKLIFGKFKQLVGYYLETYGKIQLDLSVVPEERFYFIENEYITNHDYYYWLKHILS